MITHPTTLGAQEVARWLTTTRLEKARRRRLLNQELPTDRLHRTMMITTYNKLQAREHLRTRVLQVQREDAEEKADENKKDAANYDP